MRVTRLTAVVLCAGALAACGSSSSGHPAGSTTVPANPGGGPVAARHDPCALVSNAQLSSAFALTFGAGKAEHGALQPTCVWYESGGGSAVAAVRKASEPNFDSDLKGSAAHDYERSTPVVGDDSVWFDPSATDTVSLIVISEGYQYQITVAVGSSSIDQRRTQLMSLARAVF